MNAPRRARYRVRSVSPGALSRQGAAAGALIALPPAALLAWAVVRLVDVAHQIVEGWRAVRLTLPAGLSATVNFVDLLHLQPAHIALRSWDAAPAVVFAALTLAAVLIGAVFGAIVGLVISALANLSAAAGGGAVIELEELPPHN